MIDTMIGIIGPWLIVSSLMVAGLHFTLKPVTVRLSVSLDRHRPDRRLKSK